MNDVTVRPAVSADKEAICELIGLAFARHRSTLAIVRGNPKKATRMMRLGTRTIIHPESPFDHVIVAERHGEIVGVTRGVEWPHCKTTKADMIKAAPAQIMAMGSALPRAMEMMKARGAYEPQKDHWHLGPSAIHPQQEGLGIGTALFRAILDQVDEHKASAYAQPDSDHGVAFCEQLGFKVIAEHDALGLHIRHMWREPQTK